MEADPLREAVERAKGGDRAALESLVAAIQDEIYGLAIRFLGHPQDAEEASQEALIRIITGLQSFRGRSRFRTWAFRVAANHLMNYRRDLRRQEMPIADAGRRLEEAVDHSRHAAPTSDPLIADEMMLACAHGMLLCLDREQRMAYVLGVLLELSGDEAAEILEVAPAAYRKRLQRARTQMRQYFAPLCGLVSEANPCRCDRMVSVAAAAGVLDPACPSYASHPTASRRFSERTHRLLETTEVLRGDPRYRAPDSFIAAIRALLERVPELN